MKTCGDCSLCCKLLEIKPLQSPPGEWCAHCTKSSCSIHEERPQICRTFQCLWTKASGMGPQLRPNECGVVFEVHRSERVVTANVDPLWQDAWQKGAVRQLIYEMLIDGYTVWVMVGKDRHLVLPEGETKRSAMKRTEEARMRVMNGSP